jgi:hypothetical protein
VNTLELGIGWIEHPPFYTRLAVSGDGSCRNIGHYDAAGFCN